jgi:hypothetical protein
MRFIAKRFYAMGVLFLLSPVWTFPFIDGITNSIIEGREKTQYLTLLGFDNQKFQMEYMTFHYLYIIGLWVTFPSMAILGFFKIKEEAERRRANKSN